MQLVPLGRCPKKISDYDYDLTDIKGAFFWDYSGIGILGIDGDRVLLGHIPFRNEQDAIRFILLPIAE